MSEKNYKIQLAAQTILINEVSRFKRALFRHGGSEAFIVGEDFQITYKVTNIGSKPFDEKIHS